MVAFAFIAGVKFVNGGEYFGGVDLMHLEAFADGAQESDRELPAKVLAEFLETFQDH